ncbi:MAG TPA: ribonuclease Z [Candidatus Deferrimicrobiaceae bacterium]|nr:ribonuclease Z [Candidatus Deferrimicrobiaceae bacterium]
MSIRVVFLGTSGSVPTLKRSLPAVVVQCPRDQWMFDCGENVQRQMMQAKVSFHRKMKIFITHLHGDHVLGLPGLLQTMALMDRKEPVQVYAPKGLKEFLLCAKETLNFGLTYPVEINEILSEGIVCDEAEYQVIATKSNHAIASYAYAFVEKPRPGKFYPKKAVALGVPAGELWSKLQRGEQVQATNGKAVKPREVMGPVRPGRKIVYTGDTKPFEKFGKFAEGADIVIHDCTFDNSLTEKADTDGHSTPSQAAAQAKAAKAKKLVLSHISARYPDASLLLEQAKEVFPNTILAEDYLELELPLNE